jgi:beta-glucosidase
MPFPEGFVWGAAAAAYQIEGAAFEDGKGLSIWDTFCRRAGKVFNGDTGDVACDHYHRYEEDVALMREIGLQAYRLSVSWPRVLPEGTGKVNQIGLSFYDKLIDELLAAKIEPYVTLFHWDFPESLHLRGGWMNRDSSDWFAEYTRVIVDKLGDRVRNWFTFNEPQAFINIGYLEGRNAPGDQVSLNHLIQMAHNVLLAHGKSVQVIRANAKLPSKVGFVTCSSGTIPASDSPADIEAARTALFGINVRDLWRRSWWMDPIVFGHYPEDGVKFFGADMPNFPSSDMDTIRQPVDFFADNLYGSNTFRAGSDGKPQQIELPVGAPLTSFYWTVAPQGMYWVSKFAYERYKLPIWFTENGLSNPDWVSLDGKVHDPQRIDFTARYLREFKRASDAGIPIEAYFHWSIMDNFEWSHGMKHRFGMIHVDFQTQKRTLKDSAYWYRDVIACNGANLD